MHVELPTRKELVVAADWWADRFRDGVERSKIGIGPRLHFLGGAEEKAIKRFRDFLLLTFGFYMTIESGCEYVVDFNEGYEDIRLGPALRIAIGEYAPIFPRGASTRICNGLVLAKKCYGPTEEVIYDSTTDSPKEIS